MHLLAAAADKLRNIPAEFWLKALVALAALVVAIMVLRKLAEMNKVVLAGVALFVVTMVGFTWIFERNEPSWATPAVSFISGFFPSKGSYAAKQQQAPLAAPAPVAAQRK